jgi:hypothetical protein
LPSFSSLPPLPPINSFNESEDDDEDDNTDDDIDASFDNNSNRLVIPILIFFIWCDVTKKINFLYARKSTFCSTRKILAIFLVKTQHQHSDGEDDKIGDEIDSSSDNNSSKRLVWASTI